MILPHIVFKGAPGVLASPFAMPGFGTLTAYGATAPGGTINRSLSHKYSPIICSLAVSISVYVLHVTPVSKSRLHICPRSQNLYNTHHICEDSATVIKRETSLNYAIRLQDVKFLLVCAYYLIWIFTLESTTIQL